MAAARLATPGPWVPKHTPGFPVMRDQASAMKPPACSWWGETTLQPRFSAVMAMWMKPGSGMPKRESMPSASSRSRMRM